MASVELEALGELDLAQLDQLARLREAVIGLAKRAGAAIMDVYAGNIEVTAKSDASPLTIADLRAHEIILAGLHALTPQWPVLSEESSEIPFAERSTWSTYWLVDPLDGTKEFVSRNGEFTVNIALVHHHNVALGVVYVPASDTTYSGAPGLDAQRQQGGGPSQTICVTSKVSQPVRVVGSRSHRSAELDAYLSRLGAHAILSMGSAVKFCVVAEGGADLYPRLGPTSEWDTAAAQAVVEAAGGVVCLLNGERLRYNTKQELLNPSFMVFGDRSRDWLQPLKQ
ncbi:MAG TPA: 3'(2'),5'-bisphosphate nucleotidase CysQ [Steroidobacteraceae bacterium]|nr:3'(2'),5'-bisphosphate nucleotidase CysQ [Steroidobacteraceae bacterium]